MVARADLIIRNAAVFDGLGGPAKPGDVAIAGGRVVAVGEVSRSEGAREHDAGGLALAPGFIDTHTHDDWALLVDPTLACKVSQGVTTVVTGNCGMSIAPLPAGRRLPDEFGTFGLGARFGFETFGRYIAALDAAPAAVNALTQVGHSALRAATMDDLDRPANADEIQGMQSLLAEAMEAGAIGFSTCLSDPAASAAPTSEVAALAQVVAGRNAMHSTHLRSERDAVADAMREAFDIARSARLPLQISHHKCAGRRNHGRTVETLSLLDAARGEQRVRIDAYPYVASSNFLDASRVIDSSRTLVSWSDSMPAAVGRDVAELAAEMGCDVEEACRRLNPAGAIYFAMDEGDVRRILSHPETMIGSDGIPHDAHPHPRLWGTFPRVLGHYAREVGLFPMGEAIRRMTSLPAAQFGLVDRGAIRPGAYADLVIFDPSTVIDRATFEHPIRLAAGIDRVYVSGQEVWRDGAPTGARPGRVIRGAELGPMGEPIAAAGR